MKLKIGFDFSVYFSIPFYEIVAENCCKCDETLHILLNRTKKEENRGQ
jgi:hypothetical protein